MRLPHNNPPDLKIGNLHSKVNLFGMKVRASGHQDSQFLTHPPVMAFLGDLPRIFVSLPSGTREVNNTKIEDGGTH